MKNLIFFKTRRQQELIRNGHKEEAARLEARLRQMQNNIERKVRFENKIIIHRPVQDSEMQRMTSDFQQRLAREMEAQEARRRQLVASMPRPQPSRSGCIVM